MGLIDISNKEAVIILRAMIQQRAQIHSRGNGKSFMELRKLQAIAKAIEVLEKTPD